MVIADLPGCMAMGHTVDKSTIDAEQAFQDWALSMDEDGQDEPDPNPIETAEVPEHSALATVLLVRPARKRSVQLKLVLDASVADATSLGQSVVE